MADRGDHALAAAPVKPYLEHHARPYVIQKSLSESSGRSP